jgi:hypothetical protein
LTKSAQNNSIGNVALFNSVGAGIAFNYGRLTITQGANGSQPTQEFVNRLGFQIGCLFAANSSAQNNANVFAPTFSITALNFQVGVGYELGTVGTNDTRFFFTLAYGIPLSKLIPGGYWQLYKGATPVDDIKRQKNAVPVSFL